MTERQRIDGLTLDECLAELADGVAASTRIMLEERVRRIAAAGLTPDPRWLRSVREEAYRAGWDDRRPHEDVREMFDDWHRRRFESVR